MSRIPGGGNRHDRKRAARGALVDALPIEQVGRRYRLDGFVVLVIPHDPVDGAHRRLAHRDTDTLEPRTCTLETQRFYALDGREFWVSPPCSHGFVAVADGTFSADVREAMAFFGKGLPGVRVATEDPPPWQPEPDRWMGSGGGTMSEETAFMRSAGGTYSGSMDAAIAARTCNVCGHRFDAHVSASRRPAGCTVPMAGSVNPYPCPCTGFRPDPPRSGHGPRNRP